jgi:hypothetical protein
MHTKCLSDDAAPGDRVAVGTGDREIALGCRIDDRQAMIVLLPRRLRSGRPGLPPLQLVDRNERVITRQKIHGNSNLPDRANYAKAAQLAGFSSWGARRPPMQFRGTAHEGTRRLRADEGGVSIPPAPIKFRGSTRKPVRRWVKHGDIEGSSLDYAVFPRRVHCLENQQEGIATGRI